MAGFQTRIAGDWSKFDNALTKLTKVSFTTLHKLLGEEVLSQISERFREGVDPKGRLWEKSYRAQLKGGRTLRDTAKLQRSFTVRADADSAVIGTNDIRARIHQFGGIIRPKRAKRLTFKLADGRFVSVQKVKMPARAMVGFNERNKRALADVINDYLQEQIER